MAPAPIEGSWSDRKLAAGRKFTGIGIKMDQSGNSIARIRIRYGDVWTDWRETTSRANAGNEETLELDKDKDIENISGYSYDKSGTICSLQAKSSAGYFSKLLSSNSWGPHGDHTSSPGRSLRSSPDPPSNGLRLNHCSGSTTENKYILR